MHCKIHFFFGDLSKKVQEQIRANNEAPMHVYVLYEGQQLCFSDYRPGYGGVKELTAHTELEVDNLELHTAECPEWLKTAKCTVTACEHLYGYLQNGLFRFGNVRAEVSTFPERIHTERVITTKVSLTGKGTGASLFKGVSKLYRMIRAGKVTEQSTIELWPVQVPETLVTIGTLYSEPVKQ